MSVFRDLRYRKAFTEFIRRYVIRRKYPIDPMAANDLPVGEYPIRKPEDLVVYVWGLAEHGALGQYLQKKKKMQNRGDRRFSFFHHPLRLHFGEKHSVTDLAAGYGFTAFAVNSVNKVFGTGINTDSQIGCHDPRRDFPLGMLLSPVPVNLPLKHPSTSNVTRLSAGRAHLVVCTDKEGVFTLGNNAYGQCGRNIVQKERYSGSRVVHRIPDLDGQAVVDVECGQDHTLFLTELGQVWSCGWGADGQTGLGQYHCQGPPMRVLGDVHGEKIVKLSCKADCVLALNEDGEVFTWGYGLLGRGPEASQSWQPERIPPILFGRNEFQPLSRVTSVYAGLNFSAAVTNYGDVYMWGKNKGGCLGLGHDRDQFFPLRVSLSAVVKKLALGVDHSVALCKVI